MKERAYAKINLALDVVRRREDGYHELNMIMVPLNFYDVIEINVAEEMSMSTNMGFLPIDERNTVIKAINVLRNEYGFTENFEIKLSKHIPTQAGLAGGSADGAAAIRILRKMLKLDMSDEKMNELAKQVGADVPFCCLNKPAQVQGIGEILEPFNVNTDFKVLLVKPRRGVSTKMAFARLNFDTCEHPDVDGMKACLETADYDGFISKLGNTLEEPSFEMVPQIAFIKDKMMQLGMDGALMSGSGSTVFGITRNETVIKEAMKYFRKQRYFVRETSLFPGK